MRCDFVDGACRICGTRRRPPYPIRKCTPGLGDIAAVALSSVGVTKDRAQAVAIAVGIADCGCTQRQEQLNEWGREWLGIGQPPPAAGSTGPVP
jgi:hypothetical protein